MQKCRTHLKIFMLMAENIDISAADASGRVFTFSGGYMQPAPDRHWTGQVPIDIEAWLDEDGYWDFNRMGFCSAEVAESRKGLFACAGKVSYASDFGGGFSIWFDTREDAQMFADAVNDFYQQVLFPIDETNICADDRGFPVYLQDGFFVCWGDPLDGKQDPHLADPKYPEDRNWEEQQLSSEYQKCWIDLNEASWVSARVEVGKKKFLRMREVVLIVEFGAPGCADSKIEIVCWADGIAAAEMLAAGINRFGSSLSQMAA